jgi:hypothetical protein
MEGRHILDWCGSFENCLALQGVMIGFDSLIFRSFLLGSGANGRRAVLKDMVCIGSSPIAPTKNLIINKLYETFSLHSSLAVVRLGYITICFVIRAYIGSNLR